MQERGDLVQDEAGRWVEGPAVDWGSLPARCEGVIGERIDRLPAALRETIEVASVEGETFTAEVVAQVLGTAEYEIVARLSGELDRRHRLVVSEGSQRLLPGRQRASRYRFQHILFQEAAYDDLDEAERAYLHEAVGDALERVHVGQTGMIAIQLARHYYAAARMDKATGYYLQAGDRARGLYAYAEARQHYARALEGLDQLPDSEDNRRRSVVTLIAQTVSSFRADSPGRGLARLTEAERLVQELPGPGGSSEGDHLRLARVQFWRGFVHYMGGAYRECIPYYQQALSVARASGDAELIAITSSATGQAIGHQGRWGDAKALLEQAISLFERIGSGWEWFRALGHRGVGLATMGDYAGGLAEIQRARAWAQEMNALTEMIQSDFFLAMAHIQGGNLPRALEAARRSVETAGQSGDRLYVYIGRFFQAWATSRAGQYKAAAAFAAKAQARAQELGEPLINTDILAVVNAEIALGAGRVQEALTLAQHAVGVTQEMGTIFAEGLAWRASGQALAALVPPQWDEAEAQLSRSLRLLEKGQAGLEAARTHMAWGTVCHDQGAIAAARAHWEQAAAQW
jgi:tetratricopeptide (TPR) repeat protein